ncbi:diguanylate cyclase [Pluralibacter gergoviae]|uniref:diguanylate cyclase n=1 Tax=Pluralibacter gergoviae TaxID=61647 RepID=UPI0006AC13BF|nr:diguanylate cyclase [Pluralibacter gergoviae]KOQ86338.1 diguanylate cyclase [Pluralibacter gergoviae]
MSRNLQDIDLLVRRLNTSLHAHFKWLVEVLRYAVVRDRQIPSICSESAHDICVFGYWINAQLAVRSADDGYLIAIHQRHREVHQVCRRLIDSVVNDEVKLSLFDAFESTLQKLIDAISAYQRHLLQLRMSYDALTSLPSRRILDESFTAQAHNQRGHKLYALLTDIDHFKRINDTFGHLTGDEVLRVYARMLQSCTRSEEQSYRYGGEEFVTLLRAGSDEEACCAGLRIIEAIASQQIEIGPHFIGITATAGLTRVREDEPLHKVLERADIALYRGKESGRNRCMFIDQKREVSWVSRHEAKKSPHECGQIILEAM